MNPRGVRATRPAARVLSMVAGAAVLLATASGCAAEAPLDPGMIVPIASPEGDRLDRNGAYQATRLSDPADADPGAGSGAAGEAEDAVERLLAEGVELPASAELGDDGVREGLLWLADYVAEVAVDGPMLSLAEAKDDWGLWRDWAEGEAREYLDPAFAEELLTFVPYADGSAGPPLVVAHGAGLGFWLRLVQDSEPRFVSGTIRVDEITAGAYADGQPWLLVTGRAEYVGRAHPGVVAEMLTAEAAARGEVLAEEDLPELAEEGRLRLVFDFEYRVTLLEEGWRITDFSPENTLSVEWWG